MLSTSLKTAILIAIAFYYVMLVTLLRKKKLALRYTLLWMLSGLVMLLVTIFPQILEGLTRLLGIQLLSNALFAILFFCVLMILISLSSIISKQNEYIKRLVQKTALLEKRLRELERHHKE